MTMRVLCIAHILLTYIVYVRMFWQAIYIVAEHCLRSKAVFVSEFGRWEERGSEGKDGDQRADCASPGNEDCSAGIAQPFCIDRNLSFTYMYMYIYWRWGMYKPYV